MLITFNLIALFIKTRHVLKTSQLSLRKGSWTQGLQNIFQSGKQILLHRQSSDCTPLCGAASHGSPRDNSFYLNTLLFRWGIELHHSPLSILSCQWVVPIHALNYHSLIIFSCIVAHCELIPCYRCWHQLFLPLASGFLKHCSDIQQQYPQFWSSFFCLPISGILAKTAGTLSSSKTKTPWQCVGYIANVIYYISGLENSPGGGKTTLDFMVRVFTGDKGLLDH